MEIMQAIASINESKRYARSSEFSQQPGMDTIRWLRVIDDTILAVGLIAFVWFDFALMVGKIIPAKNKVQ